MNTQNPLILTGRTVFKRQENIVSRSILDETILVPVSGNLADMQCLFALESVSSFIWEHIDGSNDLDALCAMIQDEFVVAADQAKSDLLEFIQELRDAGLIEEAGG